MKVLYYCGIWGCEDTAEWANRSVHTKCPACGKVLQQSDLHFENFDLPLHRERAAICR